MRSCSFTGSIDVPKNTVGRSLKKYCNAVPVYLVAIKINDQQ